MKKLRVLHLSSRTKEHTSLLCVQSSKEFNLMNKFERLAQLACEGLGCVLGESFLRALSTNFFLPFLVYNDTRQSLLVYLQARVRRFHVQVL